MITRVRLLNGRGVRYTWSTGKDKGGVEETWDS